LLALALSGAGCELLLESAENQTPDSRGDAAEISTVSRNAAIERMRASAAEVADRECTGGIREVKLKRIRCDDETVGGVTEWSCTATWQAWCIGESALDDL
jgi:hypothetical protein